VRWSLGGDLTLAARTLRCEHCGVVLDRDLNAAKHVAQHAGSASERPNACAAGSAGRGLATPLELAVRKQEPDAFATEVANAKFWRTVTAHMQWCGSGRALGRRQIQRELVLASPQPPFPSGRQHPLAAAVGRGHIIGPDVDLLRTPQ